MDPVLSLESLHKSFGPIEAVRNVSLEMKAGEFVTLLGPSGCGKSTTLRMIGGFEMPDRGRILLQGKDTTRVPPNKRNVNMVFQDYALFPHLDVRRNVGFGLQLQRWSKSAIEKRVDELLRLVQLESHGGRAPSELSGGQRQRIALARALAPDPPVLLLDEPLGALDAKLRRDMQIELRRLQRATGKTFILVTHDQEEALTMSDTVVVMNRGAVEQVGSPMALYNSPKTEFVARFIGEMNFLAGAVSGVHGPTVAVDFGGAIVRARAGVRRAEVGTTRTAVVRPEDITIVASRPEGDVNAVQARMKERIFRGSELHYVFESNEAKINVAARQREAGHESDEVWLSWDPQRTLLLD